MHSHPSLHALLDSVAARRGTATAIEDPPTGRISYAELAELSDRLRDRLVALGVRRGDRVGFYLHKSIDAVAGFFGAMKAGAAYVPVDPSAPSWRSAYILNDCSVRAALIEQEYVAGFTEQVRALGGTVPPLVVLDGAGGGGPLRAALDRLDGEHPVHRATSVDCAADDLAYVLYTSGSTGRPKGVMLTHGNALAFVDWCSAAFAPRESDRFSAHAPLHFDLSILDLYVSLKHGATLVLIGAEAGREPQGLAKLIAERRITIWYSAPSILAALAQYGKLDRHDFAALRTVLFAGEVFPARFLRQLKGFWPHPDYFNLYGPTETNVCTWYAIPREVPEERTEPYPIGRVCANLTAKVVDEGGRAVAAGTPGELCIAGPNVMQGYWNLSEQTLRAFLPGAGGQRWYRTGDIVVLDGDGDYVYLGRRDRMVKRRGHRVELNEIEAGLYRHAGIKEAAVIALPSDEGVRIRAFVATSAGATLGVIALKRFSAEHLPAAMVPDEFVLLPSLPKTSTDKVDYQRLNAL